LTRGVVFLLNGIHIRPRDRAEESARGLDACLLLKFYEGVVREGAEGLGRTMRFEFCCRGTARFCDEEVLEIPHVIAGHAEGKITREAERG